MDFLDRISLQQETLHEQVFRQLREAILSGEFKEGERIIETEIAGKMGISRSPLREALRKLELEGLVTVTPRKGAIVNAFSKEDIEEIYLLRSVLEGLAARLAAERITDRDLQALMESVERTDLLIRRDNIAGLVEENTNFHNIILRASGKKRLVQLIGNLQEYVHKFRTASLSKPGRAFKALEEHREILAALRQRDGERAERLAHSHIAASREVVLKRQ
ncbi:MAG: GntR family transcriptional regulator [Syntrophothermus sp.]